MRYRKRFIIYSLLAGLIVLTQSCNSNSPALQLVASKELAFSSASAIEYYQDRLYVFGDDAPCMLILSPGYQVIDSIRYWQENVQRISKSAKPDIESATFFEKNGKRVLLGIGSMSDEKRWGVLELNIDSNRFLQSSFFRAGTALPPVKETNIEGSCTINHTIILANRANLNNPVNLLLFWEQKGLPVAKEIRLPASDMVAGISGLYYEKEKDILFFTASEEATESATADGEIGESFIGWINNFSNKLNDTLFTPDQYINLGEKNSAFSKQKIESVCVEKYQEGVYTLHLVADNDNGTSRIFKIELTL